MIGRVPDFLGIGAQRAGTTWLHEQLRGHPGAWLPPVKELHFLDQLHGRVPVPELEALRAKSAANAAGRVPEAREGDTAALERIARVPVDDDWYRDLFGGAPAGRRCGEITPGYAILPAAAVAHACRLNPDLRAMLLLRDPIDRAWSQIRMSVKGRGAGSRPEQMAVGAAVLARSDYPTTLDRWGGPLGARLLVEFTDRVEAAPLDLLARVCAHLGLEFRPSHFPRAGVPLNRGRPEPMPAITHAILRERLEPVYRSLAGTFPDPCRGWLARHYG